MIKKEDKKRKKANARRYNLQDEYLLERISCRYNLVLPKPFLQHVLPRGSGYHPWELECAPIHLIGSKVYP